MTSSDRQWQQIGIGYRDMRRNMILGMHTYAVQTARPLLVTAPYTSQTDAQTYSSHSWSQSPLRDAPTTTRLTDAMTCRYSQVDMQNSEHQRLRPEHGTEDTTQSGQFYPREKLV